MKAGASKQEETKPDRCETINSMSEICWKLAFLRDFAGITAIAQEENSANGLTNDGAQGLYIILNEIESGLKQAIDNV